MKKAFLFAAFLLPIAVCGQSAGGNRANSSFKQALVCQLLKAQSGQKPTSWVQRIVARTISAGGATDSTRYYWSTADRGAAHNPLIEESYNEDRFFPVMLYGSDPEKTGTRVCFIYADSVVNNPVFPRRRRVYDYDADGRPTRVREEQMVNNVWDRARFNMAYDASGRRTHAVMQTTDSANTVSETQRQGVYSAYDVQGRLLTDSAYSASAIASVPSFQWHYYYDATGHLDSAMRRLWVTNHWEIVGRIQAKYLPNGLPHTVLYIGRDTSGAMVPFELDSFGYAGANPAYTYAGYLDGYSDTSFAIVPLRRRSYSLRTLNTAGLWDTVRNFSRDAFANSTAPQLWYRQTIAYNSFDNRETETFQSYDAAGNPAMNSAFFTRYYYETYGLTGISPKAPAVATKPWIFPNPATSAITIHPSGQQAQSATRYRIASIAGRVHLEGHITPSGSVSIESLALGAYIVSFGDDLGHALHHERLTRL